jgi:ADP-ribosyl-[dinitrogen reductase] hydrolase
MIASTNWAKGEYTDDTQTALLIAESLLENGDFVPRDIARRFIPWAETAKDVGIQTRNVLEMHGYHDDPERCAREYFLDHQESSAGNGAVMRCAPVALFRLGSLPRLLEDSRRSAQLTHWDARARGSCVIVNRWIAASILDGIRDARPLALQELTDTEREYWQRLATIETLPEDDIRSSGYTVHTVEAAIWSFLTTHSFEQAVIRAANLGDDADTVAAVTGALAGAYYGYKQIPERWLQSLMHHNEIHATALALAEKGLVAMKSHG